MISYHRAKTKEELIQILELQKINLPDSISEEEKAEEGFVTVSHSLELLERMNHLCPHIIAKESEMVVGYALCMHPKFKASIPVLIPMFTEIEKALPKDDTFIIMGQICIRKSHRKKGVFRRLYEKMKEVTAPDFKYIITEVDRENSRSLEAHLAVGFKELAAYKSEKHLWHLIYL